MKNVKKEKLLTENPKKTFLDVDFPLNKFQNDVLRDRISSFFFFIFSGIYVCGRKNPLDDGELVSFDQKAQILVDDPALTW